MLQSLLALQAAQQSCGEVSEVVASSVPCKAPLAGMHCFPQTPRSTGGELAAIEAALAKMATEKATSARAILQLCACRSVLARMQRTQCRGKHRWSISHWREATSIQVQMTPYGSHGCWPASQPMLVGDGHTTCG